MSRLGKFDEPAASGLAHDAPLVECYLVTPGTLVAATR
jgi:hypothetical protein